MSGIAGYFCTDGRHADELRLARMLTAIRHRGPDGRGMWVHQSIALGQCLMPTLPDSPNNPSLVARDALAIAADVRLDNDDELFGQLGLADRFLCDAALVLAAYEKWGEGCVEHLLGDFAFAIWDGRRQLLFCARDHFGVKPLFYSGAAGRFAFASEMKALFSLPDVSNRWDEDQIGDYLVGLADNEKTVYRDILRLPARHCLTVTSSGQQLHEYWRPAVSEVLSNDATEQFRAIFEAAVRSRLRSARPVGAMLSGGLDSSSIACVAATQRAGEAGGPLPTLSLVFDRTPAWSERRFIEAVLACGGFDPVFAEAGDIAPFADFEQVLIEQETFFRAPGVAFTRYLHRVAADNGLGVVLDGHGGDEVVSHGYGRMHELAREGRWLALWREVGGIARIHDESRWPRFAAYLGRYAARGRVGRLLRRRLPKARSSWDRFVNSGFATRSNLADRHREKRRGESAAMLDERSWHAWHLFSTRRQQSFEFLDKTAAAAGIEVRYPFWDKRLVEFCLALPSTEKLDGGWSRLILRRAMEGILPPLVQWRTDKLDFGPHIIRGMLTHHRALIETMLAKDSGGVGEYIDLGEVTAAFQRIVEQSEAANGLDVQAVWKTVVLATWLRLNTAAKPDMEAA